VLYGAGASVAYAGYILVLRGRGGAGSRAAVPGHRGGSGRQRGARPGGRRHRPDPALAVGRLALLLLIQPIASVALAAAVLRERPSAWQLAGCAVVLAGVLWGSGGLTSGTRRR
jgi:hypothetical protein